MSSLPRNPALREAPAEEHSRIQAEIVREYRAQLVKLVNRMVSGKRADRAFRQAAIGLLIAAERFDPDSDGEFWNFAKHFARDAVRAWLGRRAWGDEEDCHAGILALRVVCGKP
jgi:DNA-directed RNA polymerase specialized sigma subunit